MSKPKETPDIKQAELRLPTLSDNLYRVFGTYKIFRVLSPSFRNVPFTGLEWSFKLKDEGFDCDGFFIEEVDAELQARRQAVDQFLEEEDEVEMIQIRSLTNPDAGEENSKLLSSKVAEEPSLAS